MQRDRVVIKLSRWRVLCNRLPHLKAVMREFCICLHARRHLWTLPLQADVSFVLSMYVLQRCVHSVRSEQESCLLLFVCLFWEDNCVFCGWSGQPRKKTGNESVIKTRDPSHFQLTKTATVVVWRSEDAALSYLVVSHWWLFYKALYYPVSPWNFMMFFSHHAFNINSHPPKNPTSCKVFVYILSILSCCV